MSGAEALVSWSGAFYIEVLGGGGGLGGGGNIPATIQFKWLFDEDENYW